MIDTDFLRYAIQSKRDRLGMGDDFRLLREIELLDRTLAECEK